MMSGVIGLTTMSIALMLWVMGFKLPVCSKMG
jgi:hypothetical protein